MARACLTHSGTEKRSGRVKWTKEAQRDKWTTTSVTGKDSKGSVLRNYS